MALPGWLNRSLVALALFVGLLLLTTVVRRTSGDAVRPPPVGLPRTPDYHSLLVDEDDARRLWLGTHVGLYESRDGGRSWRIAGLEGEDVMNLVESDSTVWASGHNVFARSVDEGRTWTDVRPSGLPSLDIHGFALDPGGRLYAAVANEGLFESEDEGETFTLVSREVGPTVYGLAVGPRRELFAGDAEKGLMRSDDGGRTWRRALDARITAVAVSRGDGRLLAAGEATYLSTDGGRRWQRVNGIRDETWPVAWLPRDATGAYVVTLPPDRKLYRSVDAGSSWKPVVE